MGLPELTFSLQKAAQTTAARVSSGIVALILRDAKAYGVYTIHRESDIPAELGEENAAAIRRTMAGYINKPSVVYVYIIPTAEKKENTEALSALAEGGEDAEAEFAPTAEDNGGEAASISAGFRALAGYSYDYLAGPADITEEEAEALAELVKAQRKKRYVGKAVLPETAADDEGIINFTASGLKSGDAEFTAAQYAGRIAGVLAGTPADCSATYAALSELTGVDAVEKPDEAVDSGKLILIDDGRRVKLGRAVTSKVTLADGEPELLKKIKMVAAVDLIRYYAITTVEDEYLGKCANTYDNKCILLTALRGFFETLEAQNVLEADTSGAELDAEAIRAYLLERAASAAEVSRIKELTDDALRKEDTGSHVFLLLHGRVMDAMEDFHITLEAQ